MTLGRLGVVDITPVTAESQLSSGLTLEDLYRQHRMRLVRPAILLVDESSTAEDLVQEAFTGLYRHWSGLRTEAPALGYLRTAVLNGSRYGGLSEAEISSATGVSRGTVKSSASHALDALQRILEQR